MRIYEIATGYTPVPAKMGAATEIVVEELVKAFQRMNEDVILIDIQNEDGNHGCDKVIEVPVPSKYRTTDVSLGLAHKLKRVVYSVNLAGTIKKELRSIKEGKCILHFHNQYNCFFFLLLTNRKLRKRAIIAYTNHSYIWQGKWTKIEGSIRKRYFQESYCMRRADKVFVLNEITAANITQHVNVSKDKVVLIKNGVNGDVYHPFTKEQKDIAKKEMGLEGKRVFGQVGSVCERKNQLESVKLFAPLLRKNRDWVFCFVGGVISDDYLKEIRAYSEQENIEQQVIYLGEIAPGEKLNNIYNICDVMLFPSKQEAFGLVITEAAAAGTPTLIYPNLEFEQKCFCLRFENGEEFEEIINHSFPAAEECREEALEYYGWESVAEKYLNNCLKQL